LNCIQHFAENKDSRLCANPPALGTPAAQWFGVNRNSISTRQLRIGYVPLLDSAPLIAAVELGFCQRQGLSVKLLRQPGWANIRDNVIFGELDAAHAPAGLLLAINAGHASVSAKCVTGFVFNHQGNAITLSTRLHNDGIRDVADLAQYVKHRKGIAQLTLGVVSRYSTHAHLLRQWLRQGGIKPDKDARIVILPPSQMARCLAAGHIDGFCVGEPWNTVSINEGHGWLAAHGASLAPEHPEKVLMVRSDFAQLRETEHLALITSLMTASAWCADSANRTELARLMQKHAFPALSSKLIEQSLASSDAPIFQGADLHRPAPAKASWLVDEMLRHGLLSAATVAESSTTQAFRSDIHDLALSTPKNLALQA
jgi:ABC-type nitrate/sulfonate/bicarbonate transport system substrate-binding protein